MFSINQHMKEAERSLAAIDKIDPYTLDINVDLINRDIKALESQMSISKNRYNIANIKAIIKYLNSVISKINKDIDENDVADKNSIKMCWNSNNNVIKSYPITFKNIKEYSINACDYIELHNEKMITLDYTDAINMISFEFIHRDFGYTHEDMEGLLEDCGIAGVTDPDIIKQFFKDEDIEPYKLGKKARIDDCMYISNEKHKIKNYFDTETFNYKNSYYKDVLESNAIELTSLIAVELIRRVTRLQKFVKLIMIDDTSVVFTVKDDDIEIVNSLISDMSIRIFGRQFGIIPNITVL